MSVRPDSHTSIDESRLKIKDPPTPFLPSIQIGSVDTTDPERVPLDGWMIIVTRRRRRP